MKIALIDFSNIFRIRWHASENDETSSAVRKTVQEITGYASAYDRVAICIDSPPYRRSKILAEYKAHREKAPAVMHETMRLALDELRADGYPIVGAEGYEADDIIATLCHKLLDYDVSVDIYSADKDLMQLVSGGEDGGNVVRCVSTMTKTTYDTSKVAEKFGVPPGIVCELLALTGDKADNVPGVAGVGVKTASKWLNQYGDLDGIIEAAGQEKLNKAGNALDGVQLKVSHQLVKLEHDAPVDVDAVLAERKPKEMEMQEPETPETPETIDAPEPEVIAAPEAGPQPTQAMAVAAPGWEHGLEPTNLNEAKRLSVTLLESRLFADLPNAQAALAMIMTGRSLGLDAVSSLRAFYLVKGKPCLAAASMVGLVRKRRDVCEYFDLIESTAEVCTIETKRVGSKNPARMSFTIEDAKRAGLTNSQTYQKFPATMLRHRCESEVCRAVYSDIILGLYTVEEMEAVS